MVIGKQSLGVAMLPGHGDISCISTPLPLTVYLVPSPWRPTGGGIGVPLDAPIPPQRKVGQLKTPQHCDMKLQPSKCDLLLSLLRSAWCFSISPSTSYHIHSYVISPVFRDLHVIWVTESLSVCLQDNGDDHPRS